PQRDAGEGPPASPQWAPMFGAAGLSMAAFTPVAPEWTPKDFADTRAAWEGPSADAANIRLRIEAAAYRRRLVSMYTVGPGARPRAMQPLAKSAAADALAIFAAVVWLGALTGALLLARHNIRSNRADRRGAARLAAICLVAQLAAWALGAHHVSGLADVSSF